MCLWGDDNRVITVLSNVTIAGIMDTIESEYHRTPSLLKYNSQYWDQMITITKEADLVNCLAQDRKHLILLSKPNQSVSASSLAHLNAQATGSFLGEFYKYSWSIPYDELIFDGNTVLGKGFFGEVRLANWRRQPVAAKILYKKDFRNTTESERFIREVDVLSKLRHPKVILFLGASVNIACNDMVIVTEFMDGGSLYAHLRERKQGLEEQLMLTISIDVSLAMNYLHGENCFHRDLNSKNILLDRTMNAKLADFGLSKFLSDDPLSNSIGAVAWMAPEVLVNPQNFSVFSDVYSFSIVLWEMLTGKGPTPIECKLELSPLQLARKITEEDYRPPLEGQDRLHWTELIQACWDIDPKCRPKFCDILDTLYSFDPSLKVDKNSDTPTDLVDPHAPPNTFWPPTLQLSPLALTPMIMPAKSTVSSGQNSCNSTPPLSSKRTSPTKHSNPALRHSSPSQTRPSPLAVIQSYPASMNNGFRTHEATPPRMRVDTPPPVLDENEEANYDSCMTSLEVRKPKADYNQKK